MLFRSVNVASRFEELTKQLDRPILVSAETRARIGGAIAFAPIGAVYLRGKTEPVQSYVPALASEQHQAAGG